MNKSIMASVLFWIGWPMFAIGFMNQMAFHDIKVTFFRISLNTFLVALGWCILGLPKIIAAFRGGFGAALTFSDYEVVTTYSDGSKHSDGGTESATMNMGFNAIAGLVIIAIGGLLALINIAIFTFKCFAEKRLMPVVMVNIIIFAGGLVVGGIIQNVDNAKHFATRDAKLGVQKVKNFKYYVNEAKDGVTLTEYTAAKGGDILIPAEIDGLPVTRIEGTSPTFFYERSPQSSKLHVTSVVIPDTVTYINNFTKDYLDLKEITLPKNLKIIDKSAFRGSGVTSIVIPEGVTDIGDYAFASCVYLTSLTLPKSLERIGTYAFEDCASLTDVIIPSGRRITYDKNVFASCISLSSDSKNAVKNSGYKEDFSAAVSATTKSKTTLFRKNDTEGGRARKNDVPKGASVINSGSRSLAFALILYDGAVGWVYKADLNK